MTVDEAKALLEANGYHAETDEERELRERLEQAMEVLEDADIRFRRTSPSSFANVTSSHLALADVS